MAITDRLVLPADLILQPVGELPPEIRRLLAGTQGDVALTRPHTRRPTRIVDAAAAALLREFATPSTVAQAVLRFSRRRGAEPEVVLAQALPMLEELLRSLFLVAEESPAAHPILPSLQAGERVAQFTVVEIIQVAKDTEVYQVRGDDGRCGALKIEREPAADGEARRALTREAAILHHLEREGRAGVGGEQTMFAPGLLGLGSHEDRRYLASEWFAGTDAATAAAEHRRMPRYGREEDDRPALLGLVAAIAAAYSRLHAAGVVHADVHPRNVLVAADGSVRLIDFGLSPWTGTPPGVAPPARGGAGYFYEPEYAAAMLAGEPPPAATPAGEQYLVAALLYLLVTGRTYRDFSLESAATWREIVEAPPLAFDACGVDAWPQLESLLARALAKRPPERFASLTEMAAALADLTGTAALHRPPAGLVTAPSSPGRPARRSSARDRLVAEAVTRLRTDGPVWESWPEDPHTSVFDGAAGIALGLHRIAAARGDAALFAEADLWATRAAAAAGLGDDDSAACHCVHALIGCARGDHAAAHLAVSEFAAAAARPRAGLDLVHGRAGLVLAAALLLPEVEAQWPRDRESGERSLADPPPAEDRASPAAPAGDLRHLGCGLFADMWRDAEALPPIAHGQAWVGLGIAGGWAGILYASLRWCQAARAACPPTLASRLDQLAACAWTWQRGLRWPHRGLAPRPPHGPTTVSGWCGGGAGMVHLWRLAFELLGKPAYLAAAHGAAWTAWESPEEGSSLCCGLGGRAYGLLDLYQVDGAREWLDRAEILAERAFAAAAAMETWDSLYRGRLGVAVLAADLAHPEAAAMPFFAVPGSPLAG